jgi:RNA polymerase sigma-70 factor (ECF subfamily)
MAASDRTGELRREIGVMLPRLYRFALILARSPADADDLVQGACERALARARQFKPDTRLDRWLFRILHSIWLNELRARAVRRRFHVREQHAANAREDGASRADSTLLLREMLTMVMALPKEQRAVLLLVCCEGFTYRETADTLDIPIGTVVSRLARARNALLNRAAAAGPPCAYRYAAE